MNQRDHSLDFMKGVGCMLMVFSHSIVDNTGLFFTFATVGMFIGRLAPILFFSVSGVVNALQAKRRPLRYFAVFAGLFAVLGLVYNAYWRPDLSAGIACDIPQIVAFTIFATVVIEKVFANPTLGYLLVAAVLTLVHYLVAPYIPQFPLRDFFFIPLSGPGIFPPIPWLIFPMFGNIAYRLADRTIRGIAIVLTLTLITTFTVSAYHLPLAVFWQVWTDKYAMPVGYFFISVTLLFVIFAVLRQWGDNIVHPLITYIGRNSFPFMFVHLIWIRLFSSVGIINPLIVWPAVLLLTVPTVYVIGRLNTRYIEHLFMSPIAWALYAVALLVQLVVIRNFSLLLYVLGILFAYEYRPLAQSLKKAFTPHKPIEPTAPPAIT